MALYLCAHLFWSIETDISVGYVPEMETAGSFGLRVQQILPNGFQKSAPLLNLTPLPNTYMDD